VLLGKAAGNIFILYLVKIEEWLYKFLLPVIRKASGGVNSGIVVQARKRVGVQPLIGHSNPFLQIILFL
jgi:hypothetical protein